MNEALNEIGLFPFEISDTGRYPFGMRDRESMLHSRKYWINRKSDRVTMSCSFMETGTTASNKQWFKWKQLFSLTVTVKKPVYKNGNPSVNLFYHGSFHGRRYRAVINITRQPIMFVEGLSDAFILRFIEETLALTERSKIISNSNFKALKKRVDSMVEDNEFRPLLLQDVINYIAFPMLKTDISKDKEKFDFTFSRDEGGIPVFTTKYLRLSNAFEVMKELKLGNKSKSLFGLNIKSITPECLYTLDLLRGLIDDETQRIIIKDFLTDPNGTRFNSTNNNWEVMSEKFYNSEYTENLRQIFRKVDSTTFKKLVLSKNFFGSMERLVTRWVGLSKFEKDFIIDEEVNDMSEFYEKFVAKIRQRKSENQIDGSKIWDFFKDIEDERFVAINETNWNSTVQINFGRYGSYLPSMIKEKDHNYGTFFTKHDIVSSHPIWQEILNDNTFVTNFKDLVGYGPKANLIIPSYAFPPKLYWKFLNLVQDEAIRLLNKHKIEINKESKSFAFALVLIFITNRGLKKYKGVIPSKAFKMYKGKIDPSIIAYVIDNKLAYNKIAMYEGLPKAWIEKMMDINVYDPDVF